MKGGGNGVDGCWRAAARVITARLVKDVLVMVGKLCLCSDAINRYT